jgi:hypothetical protein
MGKALVWAGLPLRAVMGAAILVVVALMMPRSRRDWRAMLRWVRGGDERELDGALSI